MNLWKVKSNLRSSEPIFFWIPLTLVDSIWLEPHKWVLKLMANGENSDEMHFIGEMSQNVSFHQRSALFGKINTIFILPGHVAQSVTCLAADACLTADPGVASSIPARSHTFVEIDHEIISTVILLPSADSFKKGYCQLQAKVCAQITG